MVATFREIIRFLKGGGGEYIVVAEFPEHLSRRMKVSTTELRIGIDCAEKMRRKHRLLPQHYSVIPDCVSQGRVASHNDDLLFVFFEDDMFGSGFKLVVKSIIRPNELWVKTFHKVSLQEATRLFRKSGVRPLKE